MTYTTDDPGHRDGNSGCGQASNHLGGPSSCLKCPFPARCVFDKNKDGYSLKREQRDKEVQKLFHKGTKVSSLAKRFHLKKKYIVRIVNNERRLQPVL